MSLVRDAGGVSVYSLESESSVDSFVNALANSSVDVPELK